MTGTAVTTVQTNFTGGEQSPRLLSRTDVDKWNNGVKSMLNMVPLIHGGAKSTDGTEFLAEVKNSANQNIFLLKFEYAKDQALMLEIGPLYIRFYDQSGDAIEVGGSPYEITTVFTQAQLADIKWTSRKDTIILFHENVHPQRLRRFANDNWVIDDAPFDPMPVDELGHAFGNSLTLSATTGTGITITASASTFLNADVGRTVTYSGGQATITGFTSGTVVTADVDTDFSSTAIPANNWSLNFTPLTSCNPSAASPIGESITLTAGAAAWRSEDVGSYVEINGGLVVITSITSSTVANGTIRNVLTASTSAPSDAWILKQPIFNSANGYPRCGAFYKQRLVMAGSSLYPNVFWASRVRLFFDFELGGFDSDAIFHELDLPDGNPILDIGTRSRSLVMMHAGGEVLVSGTSDGIFGPLNIETNDASEFGSKGVKSLKVRKDLVFVQRGGQKIRAVQYVFTNDEFDSIDTTKLAEHITKPGITDITYQQEPDTQMWCVRSDGFAVVITIDRNENIIAASRQNTDGDYEAFEAMPGSDGLDQLWCIVKRTVNGNTKRYVERFVVGRACVHSSLQKTAASEQTVWSGFDHLIGKQVQVIVDDILRSSVTVDSSGNITVPSGTKVLAGLAPPDLPQVELYPPEFRDELGTAQGSRMNINQIVVDLLESAGVKVEGQDFDGRRFDSAVLDTKAPDLTGSYTLPDLGWNVNKTTTIEAATILPIHLLSVKRRVLVARQQ